MKELSHIVISLLTVRKITEGGIPGLDIGSDEMHIVAEIEPFAEPALSCVMMGDTWVVMAVDSHKCPLSEHVENKVNHSHHQHN